VEVWSRTSTSRSSTSLPRSEENSKGVS
jgi:hypothetical protein